MRYCHDCGRAIAEGSAFCNHCGVRQFPAEPPQPELPVGRADAAPSRSSQVASTRGEDSNGHRVALAAPPMRTTPHDTDPRRPSSGSLAPGDKTVLWAAVAIVGFAAGIFIWPIVLVVFGIPALVVLVNFRGTGDKVSNWSVWRHLPLVSRASPKMGASFLLLWTLGISILGFAWYSNSAAQQAQEEHATQTVVALAHTSATALARAHETAVVRRVIATQTAVAQRAIVAKTAAAAQKTAAPKQTAAAIAAATRTARRQAQARAAAAARAQAATQATRQAIAAAAAAATRAALPTNDTYQDVNDHPDQYMGDIVQWTCNVYKFFDQNTAACWQYAGTYDGATGNGSLGLDISGVDMGNVHSGDDVQVYGRITTPFQGTNAYGGTLTTPAVQVIRFMDLGHDPNAQSQ